MLKTVVVLLTCVSCDAVIRCNVGVEPNGLTAVECKKAQNASFSDVAVESNGSVSSQPPSSKRITQPDVTHCLISKYVQDGAEKTEFGCDYMHVCDVAIHKDNVPYEKGTYYWRHCCAEELCNTAEMTSSLTVTKLMCYDGSSAGIAKQKECVSPYCYTKQKTGSAEIEYGCDLTNICQSNNIANEQCVTIVDPGTNVSSEICCCNSRSCNGKPVPVDPKATKLDPMPSGPHAPEPGVRPEGPSRASINWMFVSGLLGAILLAVLVILGAVLFVKKYRQYQAGRRRAEEYSYRQLTIDFEQQQTEDDRMLVP